MIVALLVGAGALQADVAANWKTLALVIGLMPA